MADNLAEYGLNTRIDRDRIELSQGQVQLARRDHPATGRKYVGQVYSGGSIPTAVPAWFLTNPVVFTGAETEGASSTPTVDSSTSVPVLALGPNVPVSGDMLPARMIGGIWVAQKCTSGSTPVINPCTACVLTPGPQTCTITASGGRSSPPCDATVSCLDASAGGGTLPQFYGTFNGICDPGTITDGECTGSSFFCEIVQAFACTTAPGGGITVASLSCDPFVLVLSVDPACEFDYDTITITIS
jgi:hypothetical protein